MQHRLSASTTSRPLRVAIVGAGWAGLACAQTLTQRRQSPSIDVTMIEAAPQAGGRARGLPWVPEGWPTTATLPVDNGQHLLIGAYTATQALLAQAQPAIPQGPWLRSALAWSVPQGLGQAPAADYQNPPPPDRLLCVPSDGGLLRLLKSGMPRRSSPTSGAWPLSWRGSMAQTLLRGWRADWTARGSAEDWWRQQWLPEGLQEFFWKPLIEGALNTPFSQASAHVALRVLRDSLLGPRHASDTLHPRHNLTDEAISPLLDMLQGRGVRLVTRCRLTGLAAWSRPPGQSPRGGTANTQQQAWQLRFHANSVATAETTGITTEYFDAVVLALPARACRGLTITHETLSLEAEALFQKERERWNTVEGLGVTTLYAALTPAQSQVARLSHSTLRAMPAGQGQVVMVLARPPVAHGQVIAAVASATQKEGHEQTIGRLRAALDMTLAPRLGADACAALPLRMTHEDQATWACTADHVDSGRAWGPSALGPAGLFRAADDLTPGYPACIESAVRGGVQTAEALCAALAPRK